MITIKELNPKGHQLEPEIMANLIMLYDKINDIRKRYGRPMIVTSGIRTLDEHIAIYKRIADRKGVVFDESKIPLKSNHLYGLACDIYDPDERLKRWILKNIYFCTDLGFYFESFKYTKNWVHFQTVPPKSNRRFFIP